MTDSTGQSHDDSSQDPGQAELADESVSAELAALSSVVRRIGRATLERAIDPKRAGELATSLESVAVEIEDAESLAKLERRGSKARLDDFRKTGRWPDPPPDGSELTFDYGSFVGGELNPFSMQARYYRDGDEAIGRVHLGAPFEGPPNRVHGGAICAIFDEVLGSVFRVRGSESAFTGELTVRFVGPAPTNGDLEFRCRQVGEERRKRFLTGEASGPDGQIFATATATFITMKPEHFEEL